MRWSRRGGRQTDDEQAQVIRKRDHCIAIKDERQASLSSHARQAGLGGIADCRRPDGRKINPPLLARLAGFREDASPTGRRPTKGCRQARDPAKHRVGPLLSLKREYQAVAAYRPLADIEAPDLPGHLHRSTGIGKISVRRGVPAKRTRGQIEVAHDLVGAFHDEPLMFELVNEVPQQTVVAPPRSDQGAREGQEPPQVRAERAKVGPLHAASEANGLAPGSPQRMETAAELRHANFAPVKAFQFRIGESSKSQNKHATGRLDAMSGDANRQGPSAGDQAQPAHPRRQISR